MELAPGTSVDRFVVEDLLGRGGMASVYRIRHRDLNVAYALKIMHVTHPDLAGRIKSEGALQAELRHPNIVTVFDMIEIAGVPALVMELVDGPSLAALLDVHRPSLDQIDDIARGVLKGVRTAHTRGLIHRDLKPANVLMAHADDGYLPKITDFGLAKMLAGSTSAVQTRTGAVMGTPTYMAPEQFRNTRAVDARADIYALGVMFYELAAGRRPYDAEDLFDLLDAVRNADYPRITELFPSIPDRMADAIEGAMMVDPAQRIPDVDTLYQVWCGKVRVERSQIWNRSILKQIGESLSAAPVDIATGLPRTQPGSNPSSSAVHAPRVVTPPPLPQQIEPDFPPEEPEVPADDATRFEMRPLAPSESLPRIEEADPLLTDDVEPRIVQAPPAGAGPPETTFATPNETMFASLRDEDPPSEDDPSPPLVVACPPPVPDDVLLHTRTAAPQASSDPLETPRSATPAPAPARRPGLDSTPSLYLPPKTPGPTSSPPSLAPVSSKTPSLPPVDARSRRSSAPLLVLPALVALVGIGFALLVIVLGAATFAMREDTSENALPPIELPPPVPGQEPAPVPVVEAPVPEPEVPVAAPVAPVAPVQPRTPPRPTESKGKVKLTGDARTVQLVGSDGKTWGPGAVPAGEYELRAIFPDQEVDQTVKVTVRKGADTVIHCKTGFYSCTVR